MKIFSFLSGRCFFFLALIILAGCKKSEQGLPDQSSFQQTYNELKAQFFNTTSADLEVKRLAENMRKQDSIFKFLPEFAKKNGIPVWDKTLYKVQRSTSAPASIKDGHPSSSPEGEGAQGMFLVPLQSATTPEIKSYIAVYKHNDSSYTYRLYNKDSLTAVHAASSSEKRELLNTQAVIGYFEKTVNNRDSIVIPGPLKTSVKNVAVRFRDEPSVNGVVNSASLANTCEVTMYIEVEYSLTVYSDGTFYWPVESYNVTIWVDISCSSNGGTGGWWNGGGTGGGATGSPGGPNNGPGNGWDPWWSGGGGGTTNDPYTYDRNPNDNYSGDEDNNGGNGGPVITDYQPYKPGDPWPVTVSSVILESNFIGWNSPGIQKTCMAYAKAQLAQAGFTIDNYGAPGQTIQVFKKGTGVNKTAAQDAVGYIGKAIAYGVPVIVGIDTDPTTSSNPGTDGTTDHFVVIVGQGVDPDGRFYFRFFDNADGENAKGTSPDNKLYCNPNTDAIIGTSKTDYAVDNNFTYQLTMVRKTQFF